MSADVSLLLKRLEEIDPWGQAPRLSLSWFALTDGYYFLEVGDHNWDCREDTQAGLLWVDQRTLDTSYLRAGPRPTFWRVGDTIRVRCESRRKLLDGVQIWSSELAEHELRVSEFVEHVQQFGSSMLSQMR